MFKRITNNKSNLEQSELELNLNDHIYIHINL